MKNYGISVNECAMNRFLILTMLHAFAAFFLASEFWNDEWMNVAIVFYE
jgi:hypothetical protein